MSAKDAAWGEFRHAVISLIAAVNYAAIDTDAGFLEEELAVNNAVRAYADARVAEAREPLVETLRSVRLALRESRSSAR